MCDSETADDGVLPSYIGLRQSIKLLALAAEESSDGDIARDLGLSPNLLDSGSFLTRGSEYDCIVPSEIDKDFNGCGFLPP